MSLNNFSFADKMKNIMRGQGAQARGNRGERYTGNGMREAEVGRKAKEYSRQINIATHTKKLIIKIMMITTTIAATTTTNNCVEKARRVCGT